MMDDRTQQKRLRVIKLKEKLVQAEGDVTRVETACEHEWVEKYKPIRHEGYHCSGDPPGTMGVDRILPYDVPLRIEKRWVRTCEKCGKVQETTLVQTKTTEQPKWNRY